MAMFDQTDATNILAAILNDVAYTTVSATHIRLGTNAPTATADMSELGGGTGYTTGGSVITWNAVSAAATSNSDTVSWTNSGTNWSIVGLEIWDTAGTPLRHLWGTWTGQPVTVATGNTFQVASAGIAISLALSGMYFR
jgi:hypothetical protein